MAAGLRFDALAPVDPRALPPFESFSARDGSETLAYSWRMTQGFGPRDWRSDLAAVRRPLLVVVGADDEAFHAARYPEVVRAEAASARVEIVPGVSHLGIVGAPEVASLAEWLEALR